MIGFDDKWVALGFGAGRQASPMNRFEFDSPAFFVRGLLREGESGESVSLLSRTPKARAQRQFLDCASCRFPPNSILRITPSRTAINEPSVFFRRFDHTHHNGTYRFFY
jgi:hypothetical protein